MLKAMEPRLWRKLEVLQLHCVMCTSCCLCTLERKLVPYQGD